MMSHKHWMTQTKRGPGSPRSRPLKAIDAALDAYHKRPGTPTGKTLFEALMSWIETKANWKGSIRNNRVEQPGGKGTVETLLREVVALNDVFRIRADKALGATRLPVAEIMQLGAVVDQKAVNGRHYRIPIQKKANSCGPCCVRMVIKIMQNTDKSEDELREYVEMDEEESKGQAYAGSLGSGGVLESGGAHDWSDAGGGTWRIKAALEAAKVKGVRHFRNADVLLDSTHKKPVIGVVKWANGALHYVVAVGKNTTEDALAILDPFYGAQSVVIRRDGTLGPYLPVDANGAVQGRASWHPWALEVL